MRRIAVIFLILLFQTVLAEAEFGEYKYSKYLGIQQQLQRQRAVAIRRQRAYQQIPTRNIRYPSSSNPYPNIQRASSYGLTARQRYSPRYYQSL